MKVALDTNRYRDFCAGIPEVVRVLQQAERVLGLFFNRRRVTLLFADEETTFQFARLYGQLRQQGTPIPAHDLWIAALVTQHGAVLCTRDAHFAHLPQMPRV